MVRAERSRVASGKSKVASGKCSVTSGKREANHSPLPTSHCTFRDYYARDVMSPDAWFDPDTFGRVLDIDGHKVLGVMVKSHASLRENDPNTEGYGRTEARIYLRASDVSGVQSGQSVRVEGHAYMVLTHDILAGHVLRIDLGSADA